ncbi:hypothetical protein [Actinoplanes sp. NPDC051851]|uniref:hypothetical protein n=1 Tax=Actinoplanes sp. NPDC051851 TaxID=3154753 RepID=UPI003428CD0A
MFVTGTPLRVAVIATCALLAAAGCTSSDDDDASSGTVSVTTMRGAFLQASEIGPTWAEPEDDASAAPVTSLVSFCGGASTAPQIPPGADVISSSLADEGTTGAQTLEQVALVYADADSAASGQSLLSAVADGCQATQNVPETVTDEKSEPAYTETTEVQDLSEGSWSGFVVLRHKSYEKEHPGTADTAVAVLTSRNVVLVDTYAIYRLDNASASASFDSDWQRLVGSVIQRVG